MEKEPSPWECTFCGAVVWPGSSGRGSIRRHCACGAVGAAVEPGDFDEAIDFAFRDFNVRFRKAARGVDDYLLVELAWAGVEVRAGVREIFESPSETNLRWSHQIVWFKRTYPARRGPRPPLPGFSFPAAPQSLTAEHYPPGFPLPRMQPTAIIRVDWDVLGAPPIVPPPPARPASAVSDSALYKVPKDPTIPALCLLLVLSVIWLLW